MALMNLTKGMLHYSSITPTFSFLFLKHQDTLDGKYKF